MLYLGVICSPCEYYEHEIEEKEQEYEIEILDIKDDEDYLEQVIADYEDLVQEVVIKQKEEIN